MNVIRTYRHIDFEDTLKTLFEKDVEYKNTKILAIQVESVFYYRRKYVIVPGEINSNEYRLMCNGIPITNICRYIKEEEKPEIEKILKSEGFEGRVNYWFKI